MPYNSKVRQIRLVVLALALAAAGLLVIIFRNSGSFLVVDNRERSDAILITQSDSLDAAYWIALRLLAEGYGHTLLMDARSNRIFFGHSQAEWAQDFIRKNTAGVPGHVEVCPITADTTTQETYDAANCLRQHSVRSVLLIVDDFHSRRSLAIFSRLLPQYHWSMATVPDKSAFDPHWWQKRQWIRTTVVECQHWLWWEIVDRWRFAPLPASGPPS